MIVLMAFGFISKSHCFPKRPSGLIQTTLSLPGQIINSLQNNPSILFLEDVILLSAIDESSLGGDFTCITIYDTSDHNL